MTKPGFIRLFAAILYDLLLLIAVLFFATFIILPLNGGKAFEKANYWYPLYLIFTSFVYYGWFWTHGGQTLGLKTWKIRLLSENNRPISWKQALIRFITAFFSSLCLGTGFVWIFVNKKHRSWHDLTSKTSLFFDSSSS